MFTSVKVDAREKENEVQDVIYYRLSAQANGKLRIVALVCGLKFQYNAKILLLKLRRSWKL